MQMKKSLYTPEQQEDRFNKILSSTIVLHISVMQCKNMLISSSEFFFQYNDMLNMLMIFFMAVLYGITALRSGLLGKVKASVAIILYAIVLFCLISHIMDPELFVRDTFPYSYVNKQLRSFIAYCLPLFVVSSCLTTTDYVVKGFYRATLPVFLCATIGFLSALSSLGENNSYSMTYGYYAVILSIWLLFKYQDERKSKDLLLFFISLFYILLWGSRGPLVCIAVLIVVLYFRTPLNTPKIIAGIIGLVLGIFFLIYFKEFMQWLYEFLMERGIHSRTIAMFVHDEIANDSDRARYHQGVLDALKESPIWGLGAFGGEKTVGLTHHLYIDIFANFGYFFGTIYILVIAVSLICTIYKFRQTSLATWLLALSVNVFPRGFFDESFWFSWQLWIIMGLLLGFHRIKPESLKKRPSLGESSEKSLAQQSV